MSVSEHLVAFLRSMKDLSSRAAMESYDMGAFGALEGTEWDAAVLAIAEVLNSTNDDPRAAWAARSVAELRPALVEAVRRWPNRQGRVAAAEVLWSVSQDREAFLALVELVALGQDQETKILALESLRMVRGDAVDQLLVEVMNDAAEAAVRRTAERQLWSRHGVARLRGTPPLALAEAAEALRSKGPDRESAVSAFREEAARARAAEE
ncbi:MAG: hypothetical protein EA397_08015 [Deltaproteobacteria bacterium]|nr:MAG: hypothetical protein EA397_08015 [Deltaproteobacteria bacterium]